MSDAASPLDQAPDCPTLTLWRILRGERSILLVTRDIEAHGLQFLDGEWFDPADVTAVEWDEIVRRDPSVRELADLLPGWFATRESIGDPWCREQDPQSVFD